MTTAQSGFPPRLAAYDPARRHAPLYHFGYGMRFFLSSLPYAIKTKGIKRHVTVPILISIALVIALVVAAVFAIRWVLGPTTENAVGAFGRTVVEVLAVAAVLVLAYLVFFPLARVLLAPFADKISERVEAATLGAAAAPDDTGAVRAVVEALKMFLFQAVISLVLFVIPVAGPPLALVAGVFFNGLGALDITMARKRLGFSEKLGLARRNLAFTLGLGAAVYVVLLVPVVSLLAIPLGAVGGTLGYLRIASEEARSR
jgi:CysZ protein